MTARLVAAEWTKLRTVPSTAWLALTVAASTVLLGALVTASVNTSQCPAPTECFEDTTKLALTGVWLSQSAVVVLATLAVTSEYGTRMIHTSYFVMPRRPAVMMAKAVSVSILVVAAGTVGVLVSMAAGRIILIGNGFTSENGYPPLSLAEGPTLRAAAGTVLYLTLVALMGLGVGALVRDTVGAITVTLTVLYLFPIAAQLVSDPVWSERLQTYTPMPAGLAIQATTNLDRLPIQPWPGILVLAAYAAAAVAAGVVAVKIRDV
jgi:ABC-2 type transport system permease protein